MKLVYLLSVFAISGAFAQTISYSFSQEFETVKKHRDLGFYQLNDHQYMEAYIEKDEKGMTFQVFESDFKNLKKTETADFPDFEKHPHEEGFFSVKNDFFWFFSTWDRKTESERLFALPFDKNTFKFASTPIKLVETSRLVASDKYRFNYSNDSTKMLVTYRLKPREKRDALNRDIIGFNLFDDKMNKLYAGEFEMPYTEADMSILDHEIDSRGNIYMLASVKLNNSIDGEVDRENKNAVRYELIRVDQKSNTLQRIKLTLDNKYTNSVVLSEDLNRNLVIAGYYSDNKRSSGSNGAYIIRLELDNNNSVKEIKTTYCSFPAEVLKAYESERTKRRMEKKEQKDDLEADNLSFKKLVFYPDGSVMIIGEEFYVVTHTYYNGRSTTTSYTYYYNDILVLKADKDGKTLWCNKIPKQQSGGGVADLSFHHHDYKGEDYFFYLDNIKNINLPLDQPPAAHNSGRGGYLTCVKISKEGKMSKTSIFDIKEEEVRIYPRYFESINESLIVDRLRSDRSESQVFRLEIR